MEDEYEEIGEVIRHTKLPRDFTQAAIRRTKPGSLPHLQEHLGESLEYFAVWSQLLSGMYPTVTGTGS